MAAKTPEGKARSAETRAKISEGQRRNWEGNVERRNKRREAARQKRLERARAAAEGSLNPPAS